MKSHKYYLGKCDYNKSGRKNCKAYITWEFEDGKFSMCAEIWNPRETDIYIGGQCVDEVAGHFKSNKKAQRMVKIWEKYHLNDMHAGCQHQRAAKWIEVRINPADLPKSHANQDERGILATWVYPLESTSVWAKEKHKDGLLTKPCPECGYEYGSAWLREEIPADIATEINSCDNDKAVQS